MTNTSRRFRKLRLLCLTRDDYTCQHCGEYGDQADHIIPQSVMRAAGLPIEEIDTLDNLQTLCAGCNGKKSNKVNARHTWIDPELVGLMEREQA